MNQYFAQGCSDRQSPGSADHHTIDFGPEPFATNIARATQQNRLFRRALWTGNHLQLTLMCIPVGGEVGLEVHSDTDQFIRVECGQGMVEIGKCKEHLESQQCLCPDDVALIPAGFWHNIVNIGRCPLKLYSIYAPPHHPHGTIHTTKADADASHD